LEGGRGDGRFLRRRDEGGGRSDKRGLVWN
jgi:hypothetical protein